MDVTTPDCGDCFLKLGRTVAPKILYHFRTKDRLFLVRAPGSRMWINGAQFCAPKLGIFLCIISHIWEKSLIATFPISYQNGKCYNSRAAKLIHCAQNVKTVRPLEFR